MDNNKPVDLAAARKRFTTNQTTLGDAAFVATFDALRRLHGTRASSEALRDLAVAVFAGLMKHKGEWMDLPDFLRELYCGEDFNARVTKFIEANSEASKTNGS